MRFSFPNSMYYFACITLFITTDLMANSCNKTDIDYYLERGFTHPQIVSLCSTPTTTAQPRQASSSTTIPKPSSNTSTNNNVTTSIPLNPENNNAEQLYFATVLNASSANLTHSTLSYTSKECVEYGEENLAGIKDKVCAKTRITMQLKSLKILKAIKGVFLIKDQELLVKGNIQREYLDINSLSPRKQKALRLHLPTNPSQLNLPVSNGIDPKQVATRLNKFI